MKKQTEEKLQSDCVIFFNNTYGLKKHNPRMMMFLVPNEVASLVGGVLQSERVNPRVVSKVVSLITQRLKNTGFLGGVSDNIIVAPNKVVFVEFKLPGNYQQQNQKDFETRVSELGHTYVVIRSLEQFKTFCKTLKDD